LFDLDSATIVDLSPSFDLIICKSL